jgi:hypothetical protein
MASVFSIPLRADFGRLRERRGVIVASSFIEHGGHSFG